MKSLMISLLLHVRGTKMLLGEICPAMRHSEKLLQSDPGSIRLSFWKSCGQLKWYKVKAKHILLTQIRPPIRETCSPVYGLSWISAQVVWPWCSWSISKYYTDAVHSRILPLTMKQKRCGRPSEDSTFYQ